MTDDLMLELYKTFKADAFENVRLHRATLQHYLAFSVAVLAATIVGLAQSHSNVELRTVVIVIPLLNAGICFVAIKMCDRYYQGMLERLAVTAKLEQMLGLHEPIYKDTLKPFPKDKYIVPTRWIEAAERYSTSELYVKGQLGSGVNLMVRLTFITVIVVNIVVMLYLALPLLDT